MTTYISILRGINVSGYNLIKTDELYKLYFKLGFTNIKTYIQSGNVVFQTLETLPHYLEKIISLQIKEMFGLDVNVFIFKTDEFKEIIANNPYLKDQTKDISFLYFSFLSAIPLPDYIENISIKLSQNEEFKILGKTLYLYCPNGYSNSKITNRFIENKLKVISSTRNFKTCNKLIELAEKIKI